MGWRLLSPTEAQKGKGLMLSESDRQPREGMTTFLVAVGGTLISFVLSRTGVGTLLLKGPDNKNFSYFLANQSLL